MTQRLSTLALALFICLVGLLSVASAAGAASGITVEQCERGGGSAGGDGGGGGACVGGLFAGYKLK